MLGMYLRKALVLALILGSVFGVMMLMFESILEQFLNVHVLAVFIYLDRCWYK